MKRLKFSNALSAFLASVVIIALYSCSGNKTEQVKDSIPEEASESYHADQDIAMTVASIADAIRVGEALDSTVYNYVGVLTDGEGTPLYTDSEYYPGQWEVVVVENDSAVVRNLNSGTLMVEALQNYITESLALNDQNIIETEDVDEDNIIENTVYSFDGGKIRFELLKEDTPLGEEGPFLSISLYK